MGFPYDFEIFNARGAGRLALLLDERKGNSEAYPVRRTQHDSDEAGRIT
jgi:hypothetical protein